MAPSVATAIQPTTTQEPNTGPTKSVKQARFESLETVSLSDLSSPEKSISDAEVRRLYHICAEAGFFYLTNHSVPKTVIRRVIESSRNFFELPEEVKRRYDHTQHDVIPATCRGYLPQEQLHPGRPDTKQLFELGIERPPVPGFHFYGGNILPPDDVAPDFTKSHLELQDWVCGKIVPQLTHGFARAFNLPEDHFDPMMTAMTLMQRVAYYPPGTGFAGGHTDSGLFTVLIQETSNEQSLQVNSGGKWIPVKADEEVFVINLGDLLQFMTKKAFVSTAHRVRHAGAKSRVSLPMFIYPNIDTILTPIGEPDGEQLNVMQLMDNNFASVWQKGGGAGRAHELDL